MTWVQLDDTIPHHPKILRAGPLAAWLYICGLCYCSRYLTDGFIPAAALPHLAAMGEANNEANAQANASAFAEALASRLVEARLWHKVDGGYAVHDYLGHNRSREDVLRLKAKRAEAGRAGGIRSGKSRRHAEIDGAPAQAEARAEANREANAKQMLKQMLKQNAKQTRSTIHITDTDIEKAGANAPETGEANREANASPFASNGVDASAAGPDSAAQPFTLLEALCDELGADVSSLSRGERAKQLAVAKRLAAAGVTPDEIRREARWLQSQAWLTSGVDLFTVEKHHARWVLAGRPEAAAPARTAPRRDVGLSNEDLEAIARGEWPLRDTT